VRFNSQIECATLLRVFILGCGGEGRVGGHNLHNLIEELFSAMDFHLGMLNTSSKIFK
jgi:hypothetical protein